MKEVVEKQGRGGEGGERREGGVLLLSIGRPSFSMETPVTLT